MTKKDWKYDNKCHILIMEWKVVFKKRVHKKALELPENIKVIFNELIVDLQILGPYRADCPNYSKLSENRFHCHLTYSYVVVWTIAELEVKIVEITYVGSRENAPY